MGDHVGDRVRRCRLWRGLTQQQLADLVGWSKSALSMLETGARGLDSRSRLRQLAEALRVAPTDLTGEPYPLDAPGLADAQAGVPALEVALMDHRIGDNTDREPRTLAELEAEVAAMATATRAADAVVLRTVPGLIMELQSYGRDDERALRLLTATCIQATHGLRRLGQVPLAWIAAERCAEAAALVGDPIIIASAEFARAHSRPTAGQGMARAGQAADRMPDRLVDTDPWAQEVYGMLRLTAALAAQVRGDTDGAEAQAEEAARVADVHGERATTWESFGPANVGVWRTTLAVEAGEPARALEHAAALDTTRGAHPQLGRARRADLMLETARAHFQLGDREHRRQAVAALREAERLVPLMRASPWARELVQVMLARSARKAGGRELRGLAYRMGLDAT